MANNPEITTTTERLGDGKAFGNTAQKATAGSALGGALATIVAYVLVKSGLEDDPATAAAIGAALALVLSTVATALWAKHAPSSAGVVVTNVVAKPIPLAEPAGELTATAAPAAEPVATDATNGYAQPALFQTGVAAPEPPAPAGRHAA